MTPQSAGAPPGSACGTPQSQAPPQGPMGQVPYQDYQALQMQQQQQAQAMAAAQQQQQQQFGAQGGPQMMESPFRGGHPQMMNIHPSQLPPGFQAPPGTNPQQWQQQMFMRQQQQQQQAAAAAAQRVQRVPVPYPQGGELVLFF